MGILVFLLVGLLAGLLAGWLTGGGASGWIGNTVLGVAGSVVGSYLLPMVGIQWGGFVGQLGTATVGAVVLVLVFGFVRKRMR